MDENKFKHKVIQTYAEDMAKVIQADRGGGTVRNIIHSEEEALARKQAVSPESTKNKLFILGGVVLMLAGLVTLAFFLSKRETPVVPVVINKVIEPILFIDQSALIPIDGVAISDIGQNIKTQIQKTTVKNHGAVGVYLTINKQIIGLREFLRTIKSTFYAGSTDFVSDDFLMGFVNTDDKKDIFVILKMRSLPDIFDGMHKWETKMFSELSPFFYVDPSIDPTLATKTFEDGIIENKNARILYDSTGGVVFMYIFADDNSVIITNSLATAHEVMTRLNASRVQK